MTKELKALIEDLRLNHEYCPKEVILQAANELERLSKPEQEPFEDLAPELFVVAQTSPADDGFSDTIDRIEKWLREHFSTPPQRKPLTREHVNLFINGRGDEDDDDYVEPTGDGFGLTDADLVRLVRRVEAAHGIKE